MKQNQEITIIETSRMELQQEKIQSSTPVNQIQTNGLNNSHCISEDMQLDNLSYSSKNSQVLQTKPASSYDQYLKNQSKCKLCNRQYKNEYFLAKHQFYDHNNKEVFACPEANCTEKFKFINQLKKHLKQKHNIFMTSSQLKTYTKQEVIQQKVMRDQFYNDLVFQKQQQPLQSLFQLASNEFEMTFDPLEQLKDTKSTTNFTNNSDIGTSISTEETSSVNSQPIEKNSFMELKQEIKVDEQMS